MTETEHDTTAEADVEDALDATQTESTDEGTEVPVDEGTHEPAAEPADEPADEPAGEGLESAADDEPDEVDAPGTPRRIQRLEAEGDIAADYLEELLDIADLDGDIDMDVEGDRAAVSIDGDGVRSLVGPDGKVLDSLQELTRLAVFRETGERSRLMLDIAGHRAALRERLLEIAQEAIDDVRESGEPAKLSPMTPFERKVVHDAVAAEGLRSESQGVEPTRCVVVLPK